MDCTGFCTTTNQTRFFRFFNNHYQGFRYERQRLLTMCIDVVVRAPPGKNIFTPSNDFARGKFYYVNVPEMAEYTGTEPFLVEQTFGMSPTCLTVSHSLLCFRMDLIVEGGLVEAEKFTENGIPIGRYPGITLRNAHFQYIVTWYFYLLSVSLAHR